MTGPDHHRQQQRGERRRIGDRRARQGREQAGGDDRHVTEPAPDVADHRERHVDDALRQPADVHDLAGQQEERHRQQREAVGAFDQVLRQDLRVEKLEMPHQSHAAHQQRVGDRDAEGHGAEQGAEKDRDGQGFSSVPLTITRSASESRPVRMRHRSRSSSTAANTANTTPVP